MPTRVAMKNRRHRLKRYEASCLSLDIQTSGGCNTNICRITSKDVKIDAVFFVRYIVLSCNLKIWSFHGTTLVICAKVAKTPQILTGGTKVSSREPALQKFPMPPSPEEWTRSTEISTIRIFKQNAKKKNVRDSLQRHRIGRRR